MHTVKTRQKLRVVKKACLRDYWLKISHHSGNEFVLINCYGHNILDILYAEYITIFSHADMFSFLRTIIYVYCGISCNVFMTHSPKTRCTTHSVLFS